MLPGKRLHVFLRIVRIADAYEPGRIARPVEALVVGANDHSGHARVALGQQVRARCGVLADLTAILPGVSVAAIRRPRGTRPG